MKIAKLETHVLEARGVKARGLDRPIQFGAGAYDAFTATLVEITTDDGITGWGESIARRAPRVVDRVVRDLCWTVVEGRDPRDVEGLHDEMFARLRPWGHHRGFAQEGISGIDQALWDIVAQAQGVPLYKALGGAGRSKVPVYASKIYTADLDHMAREVQDMVVARGHTAFKIQLGRSAEFGGPRMDVEAARVCRDAAGPDRQMGADVNSAYDAATAIAQCRRLEPYDLAFIEEPVFPDDVPGYEQIRRHSSIPLAAGESEFGIFGFRDLFERRALDIAQPEIARIGGFTSAKRLGALVVAYNKKYAPHTGFSCGVAHLASLHLAAASPNLYKLEEMFISNPLQEIFTEEYPRSKDGFLTLPTKPGLGMTIDRKTLEKYRLA